MKKLTVLLATMLSLGSTAFAAVGDLSTDLVFIPVTACRIMDTRYATRDSNTPIPAGGTRSYWGWTNSYAPLGGANNNCGVLVSSDVAAIAVNFTVVTPTTAGYITAFPYLASQPLAATVNFNTGDVKGNFSIVKLNQTGAAYDFSIYSSSLTHVVGDIVGYYARPRP